MAELRRPSREAADSPIPGELNPSPPEFAIREPEVAAYVDEVCVRLRRTVTPARLAEIRAELAAHLEALIDAHVELGCDRGTAVQAALARFGSSDEVGGALDTVHRKTPICGVLSVVWAPLALLVLIVAQLFLELLEAQVGRTPPAVRDTILLVWLTLYGAGFVTTLAAARKRRERLGWLGLVGIVTTVCLTILGIYLEGGD
jgi:hypothetical protein